MSTELHIYPSDAQAQTAITTVLDMLVEGDEIDLHTEVSPPWMRVVAVDAATVVEKMRRMEVRVEVQRS